MKMRLALEKKLSEGLKPSLLEVRDESSGHRMQASESHFRALIVSNMFQGLSPVERHKKVYQLIKEEMASIHAFSQDLFTEEEWRTAFPQSSPPCQNKKPPA